MPTLKHIGALAYAEPDKKIKVWVLRAHTGVPIYGAFFSKDLAKAYAAELTMNFQTISLEEIEVWDTPKGMA